MRIYGTLPVLALILSFASAQTSFLPEERDRITQFWKDPSRLATVVPEAANKQGLFVVRQSPEGSFWLWNFNKLRGLGKVPPTQTAPVVPVASPGIQPGSAKAWETWLQAKQKFDEYQSALAANEENRLGGFPTVPQVESPDPGPAPADLVAFAGEPPRFFEPARPNEFRIVFHDAEYRYVDNVTVPKQYAYYRFRQGVRAAGKPVKAMPDDELNSLFERAGISPKMCKTMRAVSLLEGGFESVNTYDTGYLSVGVIQFAALSEGGGSLGAVLAKMEMESPTAFQEHFRNFGIDVSDSGKIQVFDTDQQQELEGLDAVLRIIEDKRLTAVFQRAGERSEEFRISQLKVAYERYYPANDVLLLNTTKGQIQGTVAEVFRTDAGIATLMDRKVNTGGLGNLTALLTQLAEKVGATRLADLAAYEYELTEAMQYRHNFLNDASLEKPAEPKVRTLPSRGNNGRFGRTGVRKGR
jgi:hypothetical protein